MSAFSAYYDRLSTVNQTVREHLPSIEWLVSTRPEFRRSGRTTALALAFLRNSFSVLDGSRTRIFDHCRTEQMEAIQEIRSAVQTIYPEVYVDPKGVLGPEPAFSGDFRHPRFRNTLGSLMKDFQATCRAAARLGVDPVWMMDQVRNAIAESVMSS